MAEGTQDSIHGRERRKRATRRALRAATLQLGLEWGLSEVTIEAITARAGVSTRTFFNYFDTKEDAALLELFTVPEEDLADLAAGKGGEVWAELTRLFAEDVDRVGQDGPDLPRYMALQERHPGLQGRQLAHFARFEAKLADAIATRLGGSPEDRMRAAVMAGSCITAVRVGLHQWGLTGWNGPPRVHTEKAFAVLAPAFQERS